MLNPLPSPEIILYLHASCFCIYALPLHSTSPPTLLPFAHLLYLLKKFLLTIWEKWPELRIRTASEERRAKLFWKQPCSPLSINKQTKKASNQTKNLIVLLLWKASERTLCYFYFIQKLYPRDIVIGGKKIEANCFFFPHAYCQISLYFLVLLHWSRNCIGDYYLIWPFDSSRWSEKSPL